MSKRKTERIEEAVKIGLSKKQISVIAIVVLFLGSSFAYAVFSGTPSNKSIHWHSDFAVFINGEQFIFDKFQYFNTGQHLVDLHDPYGTVIHFHPDPVTLQYFFRTLGFDLNDQCIKTDNGTYCTNAENSLKLYVNGQPNYEYGNYVPQDLDKILISYGPKDEDISAQLASITDLAKEASAGNIAG